MELTVPTVPTFKINYKLQYDLTDDIKEILDKIFDEESPKPRPKDLVRKVIFNKQKGATTVLWNDGTVTVVKCSEEDEWDEEKGIAVCFMKKMYENRGCFNEFLRKYLDNAERL